MAISRAVQKGTTVEVYGDKGHLLYRKTGQLQGYTGDTVSVKNGWTIYIYDERGATKFTTSA